MAHVCLTFAIVAMLVMSQEVSAKRGCSAFGHSCFGGHGKRSDSPALDGVNSDMMGVRRQLGQEETPPHPVYPHSGYGLLPSGDDIIPIRDGGEQQIMLAFTASFQADEPDPYYQFSRSNAGVYDRDETAAREVMKYKLRNIVKHWMDTYRRSQANDDGYIVESL